MELRGEKKKAGVAGPGTVRSDVEEQIIRAVSEVRYGTVHVVIHDGEVLQIERTEKVRLTR